MNPTQEQQAIIDHPIQPGQALKVIAYAGTGKTSTLVKLAEARDISSLYLAFNKSVETEAKQKFGLNVTVKTGHALAYATTGRGFTIRNIYNNDLKQAYSYSLYESAILLTSLERYLCSADDKMLPQHVEPDHLDRFPKDKHEEVTLYRMERLWRDMKAGTLPMTHSGYLKLFGLMHPNLGFPIVMLDEAQDTNPVMMRLMLDQLAYGHSVYFVGDPYQQIYSWRGAMDAMQQIEAPSLRLTESFRFGSAVADYASLILSRLFNEPIPLRGQPTIPSELGSVSGKHTILCRTNSGLVQEAYHTAKQGHTLSVAGTQAFTDTLNTIHDCYHLFANQKHLVASPRLKWFRSFKDLKAYAEEALDVELTSKILIAEAYGADWPTVRQTIEEKFSPVEPEVTLSTCHKAKGLEWDQVRISGDFEELFWTGEDVGSLPKLKKLSSTPTDAEDEIHQEEVNLLYVACTRAKRRLQLTPDLLRLTQEFGADAPTASPS